MEDALMELSKLRLNNAKSNLDDAKYLLNDGRFKSSVNRSYYAIFHALRAVTALDGFDSNKHSGIIAYFNKNYVKSGIFDKNVSKIISSVYTIREHSDYNDFYVVSKKKQKNKLIKHNKLLNLLKII